MYIFRASYILLISVLLSCRLVDGLVWVRFVVPPWVLNGSSVRLICDFDLEGERLYSVKWYKSGREIYRYIPSLFPQRSIFNLSGININERTSDERNLDLNSVDVNTSGRFKCEVLTDGPFFKTLVRSDQMQVAVLPAENPVLLGARKRYRIGDPINVTCLSPPSIPPASLKWFVNGRKASSSETAAARNILLQLASSAFRPEPSSLRLDMVSHPSHFPGGVMTITCRAQIGGLDEIEVAHHATFEEPLLPQLFEHSGKTEMTAGRLGIKTILTSGLIFVVLHWKSIKTVYQI